MKVQITTEDGSERSVELLGKRIRIGRQSSNDIRLFDLFVSRQHAELIADDDGWMIRDLDSRAGVFVNERRVGQSRLQPGDVIRLGRTQLRFGERPAGDETIVALDDVQPTAGSIHSFRLGDAPQTGVTRVLVDAAREIARPAGTDSTLPRLLALAQRATGAERGVIATFGPSGELQVAAMAGSWPGGQVTLSRHVLSRVRDQGEAVIVEDIPSDALLRDAGTIVQAGLRSVLCTPLGATRPLRGILYLDTQLGRAIFEPSHLEVVTTLAGMVGVAMENEEARRSEQARRAFEAQLAAAAEIQQGLLPPRQPTAPEGFTCAGRHESCLTVGGDFFDFFEVRDGYGVVVADVAGKGLSAALLMTNLHAVWHHLRGSATPVEQWLPRLNEELVAYLPDNRFITLAFAIADRGADELVFGSAGHNPGLLWHDGRLEALPPTGTVLGLLGGIEFGITRLPFESRSNLVLYSDGVTDQQNPQGQEYGEQRLQDCVRHYGSLDAPHLLEEIRRDLASHAADASQDDDITIAILGRP